MIRYHQKRIRELKYETRAHSVARFVFVSTIFWECFDNASHFSVSRFLFFFFSYRDNLLVWRSVNA